MRAREARAAFAPPRYYAMHCQTEATKTPRCVVGKNPAMRCRSAPSLPTAPVAQSRRDTESAGIVPPSASPAARRDQAPKVAKLLETVLYIPIPAVESRFGSDAKPLGAYVNALKRRTDAILSQVEAPGAKGLLVAVAIKKGKRSRVWCQGIEGELPAALIRTLCAGSA
jgi:hypothetical protein